MSALHITPWPGSLVTVPLTEGPTVTVEVVAEPSEALIHRDRPDWGTAAPTALPDEWVLRELPGLDLGETSTLVELTETYGPLVNLVDPLKLLPRDVVGHRPDLVAQQHQAEQLGDPPSSSVVSAALVRHHLELLRALVDHVVAHLRRGKLAPAWAPVSFDVPAKSGGKSWVRFELVLNKALLPFSANVATSYSRVGYDVPSLYSIGALQVFNMLVEELPARECAKCGRLFVRRQEDAEYHWSTPRVKFCSDRCAKAAAQAAYRARQKRKGQR